MKTFTQVFHYKIVKELPIENLEGFKDHRRLRVFHQKGTTCVTCGKIGTRLIKGEGGGTFHWDIYTEDLYPLTVDHIIPVSIGGSDEMDNLQPMCAGCNFKKGNGIKRKNCWIPKGFVKCSLLPDLSTLIGKKIYKRTCDKRAKKIREAGIAEEIIIENSTNIYVKIVGKMSVYKLKTLFIRQDDEEEFVSIPDKSQLIRLNLLNCDLKLLIGKECFKKKKDGTTLYKLPGVIKEFKVNPFIDRMAVVVEGCDHSMYNLSQIWIHKRDVPLPELSLS